MKMNIILISLVIPVLAFAKITKDRDREILKRRHMLCVDETDVDPDLVIKLKANNWNLKDDNLKKWVHCVLVKSDIMSEEAVLRLDVILSKVKNADLDKVEKDIDECLTMDKVGMFPFETAWNYAKCHHAKDPRYSVI